MQLGDHRALAEVSLAIEEGSFVAVLGPNGSGKTTLMKSLLGLLEPTEGTVRVLGVEPRQAPGEAIAYVPQVKTLDRSFPALAIELVATGLLRTWPWRVRGELRAQCLAALEKAGIAHLADRSTGLLSGGELQRVYLARALARRPRLILLDEPATGLDATSEADMYAILEMYREDSGATILMVTHDWEVAQHHADAVLLLNRRTIAFGPPAEAMREEHMRRAFGHQGHAHAMQIGGAHLHAHDHGEHGHKHD